MKKRLLKNAVATLALVSMLMQNLYGSVAVMASDFSVDDPVYEEQDAYEGDYSTEQYSGDEQSYQGEDDYQSGDNQGYEDGEDYQGEDDYQGGDDFIDENSGQEDGEAEGIPENLEIFSNQISGLGLDSISVVVNTDRLKTGDRFRLIFTGSSDAVYDRSINDDMDLSSAGTYTFDNLNKEGFNIRAVSDDAVEFVYYADGSTPVIEVSSIKEDVDKLLEAKMINVGDGRATQAISGAGYDSVTIQLDTDDLSDEAGYILYVETKSEALTINDEKVDEINGNDKLEEVQIAGLDGESFLVYVLENEDSNIDVLSSVYDEENGKAKFSISGSEVRTKRVYTYEDYNISVTATLQRADALPDSAELRVVPITAGPQYEAYMKALNDNIEAIDEANPDSTIEEITDDNVLLYDIAFIVDKKDEEGNIVLDENGEPVKVEYEPEEGSVDIQITFKKAQMSEDLGAESGEDVTLVHLPVVEEVKEVADTTLDADITAEDIEVNVLEDTSSTDDADTVAFTTDDFCGFAFISGKGYVYQRLDRKVTYKSVLGKAVNYAVVANNMVLNAHCDINFAAGTIVRPKNGNDYSSPSNYTAGKYTNNNNHGDFIIGAIDPAFNNYKGFHIESGGGSDKSFVIYTTENVKDNLFKMDSMSSGAVFHTADTEATLKKVVSDMVEYAGDVYQVWNGKYEKLSGEKGTRKEDNGTITRTPTENARTTVDKEWIDTIKVKDGTNIAAPTKDNPNNTIGQDKYYLNLTHSPAGTYVFHLTAEDYKKLAGQDRLWIELNDDQNVVFNFVDGACSDASGITDDFRENEANVIEIFGYSLKINDKNNSRNYFRSFCDKADASDYCEHVIFNFPVASKVMLNNVQGVFLAPNAKLKVLNNAAGWIVCDTFLKNGGEMHGVWDEQPDSFTSGETFELDVAKVFLPSEDSWPINPETNEPYTFTFELEPLVPPEWNGDRNDYDLINAPFDGNGWDGGVANYLTGTGPLPAQIPDDVARINKTYGDNKNKTKQILQVTVDKDNPQKSFGTFEFTFKDIPEGGHWNVKEDSASRRAWDEVFLYRVTEVRDNSIPGVVWPGPQNIKITVHHEKRFINNNPNTYIQKATIEVSASHTNRECEGWYTALVFENSMSNVGSLEINKAVRNGTADGNKCIVANDTDPFYFIVYQGESYDDENSIPVVKTVEGITRVTDPNTTSGKDISVFELDMRGSSDETLLIDNLNLTPTNKYIVYETDSAGRILSATDRPNGFKYTIWDNASRNTNGFSATLSGSEPGEADVINVVETNDHVTISGNKIISRDYQWNTDKDGNYTGDDFKFIITPLNGAKAPSVTEVWNGIRHKDADGKVTEITDPDKFEFPSNLLTFDDDDAKNNKEYWYSITEYIPETKPDGQKNVTFSTQVYKLKVNVGYANSRVKATTTLYKQRLDDKDDPVRDDNGEFVFDEFTANDTLFFKNTFVANKTLPFKAKKIPVGFALNGDDFTFTIEGSGDVDKAHMPTGGENIKSVSSNSVGKEDCLITASNKQDAIIDFGSVEFSLSDVNNKTFVYTVKELPQTNTVSSSNLKQDESEYVITVAPTLVNNDIQLNATYVKKTKDSAGTVTTSTAAAYTGAAPYSVTFENKRVQDGDIMFSVSKTVSANGVALNSSLNSKNFKFKLYTKSKDAKPDEQYSFSKEIQASAANSPKTFSTDKIKYSGSEAVGKYYYMIEEANEIPNPLPQGAVVKNVNRTFTKFDGSGTYTVTCKQYNGYIYDPRKYEYEVDVQKDTTSDTAHKLVISLTEKITVDGQVVDTRTTNNLTSATATAVFDNDYSQDPGELTIPVQKNYKGTALGENDYFEFVLSVAEGSPSDTPMPSGNGNIIRIKQGDAMSQSFGEILYSKVTGSTPYKYEVVETPNTVSANVLDIQYDPTHYIVEVSVTDDNGKLKPTITNFYNKNHDPAMETEAAVFNNYKKGEVVIKGRKQVKNKAETTNSNPTYEEFTFGLFEDEDEDDFDKALRTTTNNTTDGSLEFAPINYTTDDVGTKTYYIREKQDKDGYTLLDGSDGKEYRTVTVTITETANGIIAEPTPNMTTALPEDFVNEYELSLSVPVEGDKAFHGTGFDGTYTFKLYRTASANVLPTDDDTPIGTVSATYSQLKDSTANHNIIFNSTNSTGLTYNKPCTDTVYIKEINTGNTGVVYDTKLWRADITITEGFNTTTNKRELTSHVDYYIITDTTDVTNLTKHSSFSFDNTKEGYATIIAQKNVENRNNSTVAKDKFDFELIEVAELGSEEGLEGGEQQTGHNDNGSIYGFTPISYTVDELGSTGEKSFFYLIKETTASSAQFDKDTNIYWAKVDVKAEYNVIQTPITVTYWQKNTDGTTGYHLIENATSITFNNIFHGEASEDISGHKYLWLEDDADDINIFSKKVKDLTPGEFTFVLEDTTDSSNVTEIARVGNDADGKFSFPKMYYRIGDDKYFTDSEYNADNDILIRLDPSKATLVNGKEQYTFNYRVRELPRLGYDNDDAIYNVTMTVVVDDSGVEVSKNTDDPSRNDTFFEKIYDWARSLFNLATGDKIVFNNIYKAQGKLAFAVNKELKGSIEAFENNENATFTFELYKASNPLVSFVESIVGSTPVATATVSYADLKKSSVSGNNIIFKDKDGNNYIETYTAKNLKPVTDSEGNTVLKATDKFWIKEVTTYTKDGKPYERKGVTYDSKVYDIEVTVKEDTTIVTEEVSDDVTVVDVTPSDTEDGDEENAAIEVTNTETGKKTIQRRTGKLNIALNITWTDDEHSKPQQYHPIPMIDDVLDDGIEVVVPVVTASNDYTPVDTDEYIYIQKVILGAEDEVSTKSFTFELTALNGAPTPSANRITVSTNQVTTGTDGKATFGPIHFTADDLTDVSGTVYKYTVQEINDGRYGDIIYNTAPQTVYIRLTDNNGQLNTEVYYVTTSGNVTIDEDNPKVMYNTKDAPGSLSIPLQKVVRNTVVKNGDAEGKGKVEFTFGLFDPAKCNVETDTPLKTAKTTGGTITFTEQFKVSDYAADKGKGAQKHPVEYVVKELPTPDGYTCMKPEGYKVTADVMVNYDAGTLAVENIQYYDLGVKKTVSANEIVVPNDYDAEADNEFEVIKNLANRDITSEDEFSFMLYDETNNVSVTRTVTGSGNDISANFLATDADCEDILNYSVANDFNANGTYTATITRYYAVLEELGDIAGVTYDNKVIVVKTTLTDNGDGTITKVNEYAKINIAKDFDDDNKGLSSLDRAKLAISKIKATERLNNNTFPVDYTEPGESASDEAKAAFVSNNTFRNVYDATGNWPLNIKKVIDGGKIEIKDTDVFKFKISVNNNGTAGALVKEGTIYGKDIVNGVGILNNLVVKEYELSDVSTTPYEYIVEEIYDAGKAVTGFKGGYSEVKYIYSVLVSDSGKGYLDVEPTLVRTIPAEPAEAAIKGSNDETAVFVNENYAEGTFTLNGAKLFKGRPYDFRNEKYTFILEDRSDGTIKTYDTVNEDNGDIIFPEFTYVEGYDKVTGALRHDTAKQFTYVVYEDQRQVYPGVTPDKTAYKFVVNVGYALDGDDYKLNDEGNPYLEVTSVVRYIGEYGNESSWTPDTTAVDKTCYFSFTNTYNAEAKIRLTGKKHIKRNINLAEEVTDLSQFDREYRFAIFEYDDAEQRAGSVRYDIGTQNRVAQVSTEVGSSDFVFNPGDVKRGVFSFDTTKDNFENGPIVKYLRILEMTPTDRDAGTSTEAFISGGVSYDLNVFDFNITATAKDDSDVIDVVITDAAGNVLNVSKSDDLYSFDLETAYKFTNIKPELTKIKARKHWTDGMVSAPSVTVDLYQTIEGESEPTFTGMSGVLSASNNYEYTFEKLDVLTEAGKRISYSIEERPVPGYYQAGKEIDEEDGVVVYEFTNTKGEIFINKFEAGTSIRLAGATLAILTTDGREIEKWVTDTTAHKVVAKLTPGTEYILRELAAPTGYNLAEDVRFTVRTDVSVDDPQIVSMEDPKIVGNVLLIKRDADTRERLAGAEFAVYRDDGTRVYASGSSGLYRYSDTSSNGRFYVDGSGELEIRDLPYGTYYFEEIVAPAGYALNRERVGFSIHENAETVEVSFLDPKVLGAVRLTKTNATGSRTLAGAVFELYARTPRSASAAIASTIYRDAYYRVGTYTTDEAGRIAVDDLPWDDYYFIEVEAPDGYVLNRDVNGDPVVYRFTIDASTATSVAYDLGTITNDAGEVRGRLLPPPEDTGRRLGGVLSGVLGVRAAPDSGVLGERVGPVTGDAANMILWLLLLVACLGTIIGMIAKVRKREKRMAR